MVSRLSNLRSKLESLFRRVGRLDDLEEAIRVIRNAVRLTPNDSPGMTSTLYNLGTKLECRFELLRDLTDRAQSSQAFYSSWKAVNAFPKIRILAAKRYIQIQRSSGLFFEALEVAKGVLDLLPSVSTRAMKHDDRQEALLAYSGIAADACALSIQGGGKSKEHVQEALKLSESGRGALLNLLLEDRIVSNDLQQSYPEHAAKLDELKAALNDNSVTATELRTSLQPPVPPSVLLRAFNECVDEIRSFEGFQDFMQAPSVEQMQKIAGDGMIVVVNVSDFRSDALLLSTTSISQMQLAGFEYPRLRTYVNSGLASIDDVESEEKVGKMNSRFRKFLKWLWQTCVGPILERLGYRRQEAKSTTLPRVWWIGTGVASSLPFHAAGDHFEGSDEHTFNRIVSSYTPTIRALIHAKQRAHDSNIRKNCQHRLLLASMSTTPGFTALEGVKAEALVIKQSLAAGVPITDMPQSNAQTILDAFSRHDMFHFAGHGRSDALDPGNSCLLLERAGTSGVLLEDPLTVKSLLDLDIQPALLAFLSACSTAENRAALLADEGIHLASAFVVAGFANVIASLWPSYDHVCVAIAEGFYSHSKLMNADQIDDGTIARAFHTAVQRVYRTSPARPLQWAQYIHVGA